MSRGAADRGCLVYVGNLPDDIREREIEDLFSKFGRVLSIDMKAPVRPPAFAFVEFSDPRDAEDAVRDRDGYDFYGNRLRVELAKGAGGRGGGRGGDRGGFGGAPPPGFRPRQTGFRVLVKGLPMSASWQDLKDFIRQVCKPAYTNVVRDRDGMMGVVEFETIDDMERTIRKLDDTEFRNPFDRAYVRVVDDRDGGRGGYGGGGYDRGGGHDRGYDRGGYDRGHGGGGRRSRSRSRSRSRDRRRSYSRSRSRSPRRSDDRSRSRSKSLARSDRSRSRSRSKSPARSNEARSRSPSRGRSPSRSPPPKEASPRPADD